MEEKRSVKIATKILPFSPILPIFPLMKTTRINIWSSPRNISTAFMYSFAQRPDTTVVDEPLYAHFLSKTDTEAEHPGREETLASMEQDGEKVVQEVIFSEYTTPIVLFKQMTHHLIELNRNFMQHTENVLLIRNPRAIIASYAKVIPNPSMHDIGVEMQYELMQQLQAWGKLAAVVDAKNLLLDPPGVLRKLCERLNIPFDERMLSWSPGARPEDGVWAKYWYANVHSSTGFQPYVEKDIVLPAALEPLAEACEWYYERLYEHAL